MGASVLYPCGCGVQHSMFGKRPITGMLLCQEHAEGPGIQSQMQVCIDSVKAVIEVAENVQLRAGLERLEQDD